MLGAAVVGRCEHWTLNVSMLHVPSNEHGGNEEPVDYRHITSALLTEPCRSFSAGSTLSRRL